jgi:hypothetical protein
VKVALQISTRHFAGGESSCDGFAAKAHGLVVVTLKVRDIEDVRSKVILRGNERQ